MTATHPRRRRRYAPEPRCEHGALVSDCFSCGWGPDDYDAHVDEANENDEWTEAARARMENADLDGAA